VGRARASILVCLLVAAAVWAPRPVSADGNEGPQVEIAARALSASTVHTCAILDNSTLKCWGGNASGQLGIGDTLHVGDGSRNMGDRLPPVDLGPGRTAVAVAVNSGIEVNAPGHTCVILDDGHVKCWGEGDDGRLGSGSTEDVGDEPGEVTTQDPVDLGSGRTAVAIAAGEAHTCAILDDGHVKCWGNGQDGALGTGDEDDRGDEPGEMGDMLPDVDLGTGRTAVGIAAGLNHSCALLDDGTVKCWGDNGSGRLGYGDQADRGDQPGEMGNALPPVDLGAGRIVTAIATGRLHTCALMENGSVKCWGSGGNGRLGSGATADLGDNPGEMGDALQPLNAPGPVVEISPGGAHTCVLDDFGVEVRCWGLGADGQLGVGTANVGDSPDELSGTGPVLGFQPQSVTTGGVHSCAVSVRGALRCWGSDIDGQLGLGSTEDQGDDEAVEDLPTVDLGAGRTAVPVSVTVAMTASPPSVVVGQDIDYEVTVTNTAGRHLYNVRTRSPEVPDCTHTLPEMLLGESVTFTCTHTATAGDVPRAVNVVYTRTDDGAAAVSAVVRTAVAAVRIRPDALIRLGNGALAGNDVYNATGTGQTRTTTVRANGTATFTVRAQNDGNTSQVFEVAGRGGTNRYTVTYRRGATNVTAAVVAGTYATPSLARGARQDLTVTIRARAGAPVGAAITRAITVRMPDNTRPDVVKATVTRRR
jgi:alpha-tubulin suppressor-like RCC1 family protein